MENEMNSTEKKDAQWTTRAKGTTAGNRLTVWVITRFGLWPAYILLIFASIQYVLLDKNAKTSIKILRKNLGIKSGISDYFKHFYSFGMALIDRFYFLFSKRDYFKYTSINEELIFSEVQKGRGVILLGAHVGNWEIAGNLLQDRIHAKVNFLMYDAESEKVKRAVAQITKNRNVGIIYINRDAPDTMVEVVNALRRGEIVCMHGDRMLGAMRSERVSFLGKDASFPVGAFAIASISGASVIPFFAIKNGFDHYTFSASGPICIGEGDRASRMQRIRHALEMYVKTLEEIVIKYPYQWYNFYDFWHK
jgi:predicted LPLAT superfamily acyltransferase